MNLVIEKNFGEMKPVDALKAVINSHGNHFVMAYGYISTSDTTTNAFDDVKSFLRKSEKNRASIFVGLPFSYKVKNSLDDKINELDQLFENLLPDSLYQEGLSKRISVYGVKNFHPKFSIMFNEINNKSRVPVMALTGSSNLSAPAYDDIERFELDILMSSGDSSNLLLNSFSRIVLKMLTLAFSKQDVRLGEKFDNRVHWKGVERELFATIAAEIEEEELKQEFRDLKYYAKSASSIEDGAALHESDVALGICSEYEKED